MMYQSLWYAELDRVLRIGMTYECPVWASTHFGIPTRVHILFACIVAHSATHTDLFEITTRTWVWSPRGPYNEIYFIHEMRA